MTLAIQQLVLHNCERWGAVHRALYVDRDVDAVLAATGPECTMEHQPVGSGAGPDGLPAFLAEQMLPHLPDDLAFDRLSRTVDQRRLVEEAMVSFTHDRALPWLLPGVDPTDCRVSVRAVSIAAFRHVSQAGRTATIMTGLRTLWDHHTLLQQLQQG